jgi:hypothetical protein
MNAVAVLLTLFSCANRVVAQNPLRHPLEAIETRYASAQPVIRYTLRADSADPSGYDVTIHIRHAPDTFRLALATHPKYDDEYWRYVRDVRIEAVRPGAFVTREDSAVWRAVASGGESVVRSAHGADRGHPRGDRTAAGAQAAVARR